MRARNFESVELILLTVGCAVATVVALCVGHARTITMIGLTALMALMAFVARFRHHRHIRTLDRRGRRRYNGHV